MGYVLHSLLVPSFPVEFLVAVRKSLEGGYPSISYGRGLYLRNSIASFPAAGLGCEDLMIDVGGRNESDHLQLVFYPA
jgi:hypothetical protein